MQTTNEHPVNQQSPHRPSGEDVIEAIGKRSFATLSTVSPAGRPHGAGVLYALVGNTMYINTLRSSRKARNLAANPNVGLVVPIRRLPVGPPSTVHFQARAALLDLDAPEILNVVKRGELDTLTSHGELDMPNGCFIRIQLPSKLHTYGLGMPLLTLIRDPLSAGGLVQLSR